MAHATQTSKYARWWSQMNGPEGPQKAGTVIAVLLVLGAGALVVPLPGPLLDLLLSANLAASLAVFALMLLAARPERLAGVPGLLVVSSLLRVTLAVAVGRHILLAGSGGTLVSGLGELAAGHSWAAGLFLVLMLAVIDMVVVGVGMVRVSEVLARFALDALPGRQMAIDNAVADGRLDREEAVSEQRRVEAESAFYGAMDGAARFLRGDCVATIVIVVATPLAALLTGTGREMTDLLTTAAGHGLAILLPGLLVGGAGAVALSRAGSSQSFGVEIAEQLVLQPAALIATSVVLLAIALVAPGARLPLIGMVVAVMAVAVAGLRSSGRRQTQTHPSADGAGNRIEVGMGLVHLIVQEQDALAARLSELRGRVEARSGIQLAPFNLADSEDIGLDDVRITVFGEPCVPCSIKPGRLLAPGGLVSEFAGSTPAVCGPRRLGAWIAPEQAELAESLGLETIDCIGAILLMVEDRTSARVAGAFTTEDAEAMLQRVSETSAALAARARAAGVDTPALLGVCRALLAEGVGIHSETAVVEAACRAAEAGAEGHDLAEKARKHLAAAICRAAGPDGVIHAVELSGAITESIGGLEDGQARVAAEYADAWADLLTELGTLTYRQRHPVVVLCSPAQRPALGALIVQSGQPIMAIAHDELSADYRVQRIPAVTEPEPAQRARVATGIEE